MLRLFMRCHTLMKGQRFFNKQNPIEMIHFMLDAAGQKPRLFSLFSFRGRSVIADHHFLYSFHLSVQLGDAEAGPP
mgnify:CR=1 FL=1